MRCAIVGAGVISYRYAERIAALPELELVGVTDLLPERARQLAAETGATAYGSLDELLADERVDTVVNLTAPEAHAPVTAAALQAGRHVHTEKPLALRHREAQDLVELAALRGVRLSCAPSTSLGEAAQTLWKHVRDGLAGRVRVAYAEANWGRIEEWHPTPQALYDVGPLVDVGVYPITILTTMFGAARRVTAYATSVEPERTTKAGEPFTPGAPDWVVATLELEQGVVARVTATFYVPASKQRGIELHGDAGSLYIPTWAEFDSRLEFSRRGGEYETLPLVREPYHGIDWARPLADLAEALGEGRPHRSTGEQAAHVVEILEAASQSIRDGGPVELASTFPRPEPLEWAR